jgi:hypothetical protein
MKPKLVFVLMFILILGFLKLWAGTPQDKKIISPPSGVCPPFYLMDEESKIIDPVHNINADQPYSPKQTCGKCHDYNKITEGFHFQQGRGEKPNLLTAERCLWVTSPGNYGGNW